MSAILHRRAETALPSHMHFRRGTPFQIHKSKFSVNGITIDPRPVLGEPIPWGCLHLLVWIQSSPTSFCPLVAHGMQSSACADVNI
jgi:hypothetical protein